MYLISCRSQDADYSKEVSVSVANKPRGARRKKGKLTSAQREQPENKGMKMMPLPRMLRGPELISEGRLFAEVKTKGDTVSSDSLQSLPNQYLQ